MMKKMPVNAKIIGFNHIPYKKEDNKDDLLLYWAQSTN